MEQQIQNYIEKHVFHYDPVFLVSSSKTDTEGKDETQIIKDPSRKAFWLDQSDETKQHYTDYDLLVKDIIKKVLP